MEVAWQDLNEGRIGWGLLLARDVGLHWTGSLMLCGRADIPLCAAQRTELVLAVQL